MALRKKAAEGFVEGAAVEVSKWVVGALLVLATAYGGAVLGFARENVINPMIEYPWAFAAVLILGALFGFTGGMIVRHHSLKKAQDAIMSKGTRIDEFERAVEAERKNAEAVIAEKDAKIAELEDELQGLKDKAAARSISVNKFDRFKNPVSEDDLSKIRTMDYHDKVMVKAVATKGFVFCRTSQAYDFYLTDVSRFVDQETLRNDVSRLHPKSKLVDIAKNHADSLCAVGDEDLARRDCSLDRGVITRPKSNAGGRTWWWTDDPNCAEEFL